jgi:hypothetical protein
MIPESRNLHFEFCFCSAEQKTGGDPKIPDAASSLYWNFLISRKQANSEKMTGSTPKTGITSSRGADLP